VATRSAVCRHRSCGACRILAWIASGKPRWKRPRTDGFKEMNGGLQWILLVLSCLSLAGLGLSGFLVSRAQNYRQKRDARLAMVVTPHIRAQKVEISAITQSRSHRDQSIEGMAARVFGFDPASPDRYPVRWWMLVAITGALSVAAHTVVATWGFLAWL